MPHPDAWTRFQKYYCSVPSVDMSMDVSRIDFSDADLAALEPKMQRAFAAMKELESGAIANPDEKRMVGHYWLRAPEKAPADLRGEIESGVAAVKAFAAKVHSGEVKPPTGEKFTRVLSIGIGGSALGPMFVADALGHPLRDQMPIDFIDNTDPDGIARVLDKLGAGLAETLVVVTSKSGGTPETRNGMLVVQAAYHRLGLDFGRHAVAITMPGSKLDKQAVSEGWVERFPMFDWVGGRTSVLSAVGLLPAALQGIDIDGLLSGARDCDEATRVESTLKNPAALLAAMWHIATDGKGAKDMVVLPYKDRLLLFSRYLQQLVMESLGKELDIDGQRVEQGIAVYGNKGSTDQHAYVQQLREGVNNFFVTFIRVLEAGNDEVEVEPGFTSGDYLHGFFLGTREALSGNNRESLTITVGKVDARTVGALIALFERAVGFYATLVNINAYHQPGVEAGKKAAAAVLELQAKLEAALSDEPKTASELAGGASVDSAYHLLEHLARNGRAKVHTPGAPGEARFTKP